MKQWKYIGTERKYLCSRWMYPGNIINNPEKPNSWFVEVGTTKDTNIVHIPTIFVQEPKLSKDGLESLRLRLNKMKMKDLREIGDKYDVHDTSKSELVEEIIQARIKLGEL